MRASLKSKRVSWASDGNLCQVKLFLSEESPSQVGLGAQDHLQAKKTLHALLSTGILPDDSLPPGFEGFNPSNQSKNDLAQIPRIKWICPPRFILNAAWRVVAGEESGEVEVQNQRELRVLEAIYPRPSAIPPNPAFSSDTENSLPDDQRTLLIPITPIEEEDAAADLLCGSPPATAPVSSHAILMAHGTSSSSQSTLPYVPSPLENGILPASAALTALVKNNEPGNLIDHNLLVKILGASALASNGSFYSHPNGTPHILLQNPNASVAGIAHPVPTAHSGSAPAKDINYYKSLIQQHGGDKQAETVCPDSMEISKPKDSKLKIMKPCIYFNSSKGCRHGANCAYQHDALQLQRASSIPEMQRTKRMKMDREI
ncbi:hypothetical protein Nepgr_018341 [Nepenthes gracilis]|uniref:C3H1-type domain-containing protein n=1 Tax=Nepenthes gracilis TaxID=150966 RepID=A0AAD3XU68_NEPGR|nr:hypothetical protein Nepgr_018341 [Nepenthes gracilis]